MKTERAALQIVGEAADLLPLLATPWRAGHARSRRAARRAGRRRPGLILKLRRLQERRSGRGRRSPPARFAPPATPSKAFVPRDISAFAAGKSSAQGQERSPTVSLKSGARPCHRRRQRLLSEYLAVAAPTLSRKPTASWAALFTKHCANCHTLFGERQDRPPTGSQHNPVVLSKIRPGAVVNKDYQMVLLSLEDGR